VHSWGSASGTEHLHTGQSLDLTIVNRETPGGTGIAQKWDGSEIQMKGCATSKGSSIIRSAFADPSHCGQQ